MFAILWDRTKHQNLYSHLFRWAQKLQFLFSCSLNDFLFVRCGFMGISFCFIISNIIWRSLVLHKNSNKDKQNRLYKMKLLLNGNNRISHRWDWNKKKNPMLHWFCTEHLSHKLWLGSHYPLGFFFFFA